MLLLARLLLVLPLLILLLLVFVLLVFFLLIFVLLALLFLVRLLLLLVLLLLGLLLVLLHVFLIPALSVLTLLRLALLLILLLLILFLVALLLLFLVLLLPMQLLDEPEVGLCVGHAWALLKSAFVSGDRFRILLELRKRIATVVVRIGIVERRPAARGRCEIAAAIRRSRMLFGRACKCARRFRIASPQRMVGALIGALPERIPPARIVGGGGGALDRHRERRKQHHREPATAKSQCDQRQHGKQQ